MIVGPTNQTVGYQANQTGKPSPKEVQSDKSHSKSDAPTAKGSRLQQLRFLIRPLTNNSDGR
jgi:hypothetical protein